MKRQFFSGNSLEQAVMAAARHFSIDPDRVAYAQREKKHGFLKGRRRVVIEVDGTAPERSPEKVASPPPPDDTAASFPARQPTPEVEATRQADQDVPVRDAPVRAAPRQTEAPQLEGAPASETAAVERAVDEILRFLSVEGEVTVKRRPDVFAVDISEPDEEYLIDREGRLLQAMEYLIPRLVRSWTGQGVPVKVDSGGFRALREQELCDLASRVAAEVRRDGTSQSLEPMSPADRRLVHLALADDPDVETESEGQGFFKRIRISAPAMADGA